MGTSRRELTANGHVSLPAALRRRWGVTSVLLIDNGDYAIVRPLPSEPIGSGQAGLRVIALDAEAALAAGRLRAAHDDRRTCVISMADCVAAVAAVTLGRPLATSDPALAGLLRSAGGAVVALPDSSGRRP